MSTLPRFDYVAPGSVSAACTILGEARNSAVLAGGSDLMVQMKQRTRIPELVVGIKKIPELQEIRYSPQDGLRLGAAVTLQSIASSSLLKEHYPLLAEAASLVGATQHQFMGTVGGNLCLDTRCWYFNHSPGWRSSLLPCHKLGGNTCHAVRRARKCYAVYSADVGAALVALESSLTVASGAGRRELPLGEKFFSGDSARPFKLQKGDLLTQISLPARQPTFYRYYKLRMRGAIDFPQLGVILLAYEGGKDYRLVVNAVGGSPLRFPEIEQMLAREKLTENLVKEIISRVLSRVKPVANIYGSPAYRRKMAGVLLQRAFTEMGIA